jgi:regulatory protein
MKVTAIKQQARDVSRYSVFVDNKYSFSLSESALLNSKLVSGQELDDLGLDRFMQLSTDDKLYNQALHYVAARSKTEGEIRDYLRRKNASDELADETIDRLSRIGLIDDEAYVRSYINSRQNLKPTSKRKLIADLSKKHIKRSLISDIMDETEVDESSALKYLIEQKRRQLKYRDDAKLMQYLARQGFNYGDIKSAIESA